MCVCVCVYIYMCVCVYVSRICLSSIPANHNTHLHLISPEPQSSTPARHLILITSAFINTSTRALLRPVSSRHCWTLTPFHLIVIIQVILITYLLCLLSVSSSSSVLLLSDTSSCSSPEYPASVPIHDLLDLEGYHLSDLLFTLQSIIIPVTHLLPAVHLWTYIKTSPFNISLCVWESFHNRRLDRHRTKIWTAYPRTQRNSSRLPKMAAP